MSFLKAAGVDSAIFYTSGARVNENFYYFTGLSKSMQLTATALLTKNGMVLLTNRLEHELLKGKGKLIILEKRADWENAVRKYCTGKVGSDFSSISVKGLANVKKVLKGRQIADVSKHIGEARAVKTSGEIRKIKEACNIAEDVLDRVSQLIGRCKTEAELGALLEYEARKNGSEGAAYPPIVAFGANAALGHHFSSKTSLKKGLLLIDFGIVYDGYCSDLTRMYSIGKADEKLKEVYSAVYSAQQAAVSRMKVGASSADVHGAANSIIKEKLGQEMIHATGHGLGIEVHDFPEGMGPKYPFTLKKNMVITVEPGYYKKGWGGVRIEDDVVVGGKLLSRAPSSITEI